MTVASSRPIFSSSSSSVAAEIVVVVGKVPKEKPLEVEAGAGVLPKEKPLEVEADVEAGVLPNEKPLEEAGFASILPKEKPLEIGLASDLAKEKPEDLVASESLLPKEKPVETEDLDSVAGEEVDLEKLALGFSLDEAEVDEALRKENPAAGVIVSFGVSFLETKVKWDLGGVDWEEEVGDTNAGDLEGEGWEEDGWMVLVVAGTGFVEENLSPMWSAWVM